MKLVIGCIIPLMNCAFQAALYSLLLRSLNSAMERSSPLKAFMTI